MCLCVCVWGGGVLPFKRLLWKIVSPNPAWRPFAFDSWLISSSICNVIMSFPYFIRTLIFIRSTHMLLLLICLWLMKSEKNSYFVFLYKQNELLADISTPLGMDLRPLPSHCLASLPWLYLHTIQFMLHVTRYSMNLIMSRASFKSLQEL